MASSEIVDSARLAGHQKSNFSQTCYLLSQYLKEKGSFGDLSLGIHRNFDSAGTPTATATMDLLPMIEKSGETKPMNLFPHAAKSLVPEKAQMTIFYGGQVIVFNDFPADKAKEIILLASNNNGNNTDNTHQNPKSVESASDLAPAPAVVNNMVPSFGSTLIKERSQCQMLSQPIVSDLPIARRASLTRFLEKRKDRLTTKAPYTISNPNKQGAAPPKQEESKAWLGLGAQFPVKTEQ